MNDILFISLVLISALFSSIHAMLLKTSQNRGVTIITTSVLYIVIGCIGAFFFPLPSFLAFVYLLLAAIFTTIQVLASHFALDKGDLTLVWPFQASIKFLTTVIVSIFLFQEPVTLLLIISIFLIVMAIFFVKPLEFTTLNKKAILGSIVFGVSLAIQLLLIAKGIQYVDNPGSYIVWDFIMSAPVLIIGYMVYKKDIGINEIYRNSIHNISIFIMDMLSYSIILYLFYVVNVTHVFIWKQASLLFTLVLGCIILKEHISILKVIGFILLVIGLILSKI